MLLVLLKLYRSILYHQYCIEDAKKKNLTKFIRKLKLNKTIGSMNKCVPEVLGATTLPSAE